ncbi:hypothetical protein F444_18222 [Phytophthora nicotianae P1976]|uniref:Uncharacterized protein n=1 Tax=Phytophthora nicotianae P1976 TaxID=1317066 RepID=A0A080ZC39_PHYNI|nr:hypothetical protein F444_18222 [Phytophthora nicotianae P1976]
MGKAGPTLQKTSSPHIFSYSSFPLPSPIRCRPEAARGHTPELPHANAAHQKPDSYISALQKPLGRSTAPPKSLILAATTQKPPS